MEVGLKHPLQQSVHGPISWQETHHRHLEHDTHDDVTESGDIIAAADTAVMNDRNLRSRVTKPPELNRFKTKMGAPSPLPVRAITVRLPWKSDVGARGDTRVGKARRTASTQC